MLQDKKINWSGIVDVPKELETKAIKQVKEVKVSSLITMLEKFVEQAKLSYEYKSSSELYGVIVSTEINLSELRKIK
jgi:hypothetical protein